MLEFTVKNYRCFSEESPLRFTIDKGFTALIGTNNSGKSAVLRFIYEFRNFWVCFGFISTDQIKGIFGYHGTRQFSWHGLNNNAYYSEIFYRANNKDISIEIKFKQDEKEYKVSTNIRRDGTYKTTIDVNGASSGLTEESKYGEKDRSVFKEILELRESLYIGSYRNLLPLEGGSQYLDLTVGKAFISFWRSLKESYAQEGRDQISRVMEDINSILHLNISFIDVTENSDNLILYFKDGSSRLLDRMGAGVSEIIMLFINIIQRKPKIILIDEPELRLHPALQLNFLEKLAAYSNSKVIFTTHSIGLAKSAADRIYIISRAKDEEYSLVAEYGKSSKKPNENYVALLSECSFSRYVETGYRAVLFAEGATEVKVFHQWLKLYKLEKDVVIIPLGGSNLISQNRMEELEELKRFVGNDTHCFALIDGEVDDEKTKEQRQEFKKKVWEMVFPISELKDSSILVTERKATENYFTQAVLDRYKEGLKALGSSEKLDSKKHGWSKGENWLIAKEMHQEDLESTDIGEFLIKIRSILFQDSN